MNKTLVIYDNSGFIISQMQGSELREPTGVPFLWVEIPAGKQLTTIDVTVPPHVPVFEDVPNPNASLEQMVQQLQNQLVDVQATSLNNTLIVSKGLVDVYSQLLALKIDLGVL